MPATTTLSSTTLAQAVGASDAQIRLSSTSGLTAGIRLFCEGELMRVVSLGPVACCVNVQRGVDGTAAAAHSTLVTVYVGRADQFYGNDPVGAPPAEIPVSPWINVVNGSVWFAQGDPATSRWWQKSVTTYSVGSLGVRNSTLDPSAST